MEGTRSANLPEGALIWDMVWPYEPSVGNSLAKLRTFQSAGYHFISLTMAGDNQNIAEAVQRLAGVRTEIAAESDWLVLVESIGDVDRAVAEGKLAVGLHFEGTRCLERNLEMIEVYYALGVRHNLLAFNVANSCGSGCADKTDSGLTVFGRRVVTEMDRTGMLLDLSHVGHRTSLDAIEIAAGPVVFTHSNVASLAPGFRNLSDDQIDACGQTGGVIGISGASTYLGDEDCRSETVFRHIDYIAQRIGAEHVGLGLDVVFNADAVTAYARGRPDEWPVARDPSWPGFRYVQPGQVAEIAELMSSSGYSTADVRGVLGENFYRVCSEVWK
ncbi:membrane dipeptidase [Haliea sp. E1-2-M8]|uniref:dipeptidase n=1 Tax=Haliea sp. E1-2-M8 TaxID=3064706 RepID=UPI002727946F|nr:membrane dipeptidase [Haliea sp. E1-2-M8]MDO8861997.1 membrane dipeptidase [Haliea sp. E1-2-M8]